MSQNHHETYEGQSKWRIIGAMGLLAILILVVFVIINAYAQIPTSSDFLKFYSSVKFLFEGKSIYTPLALDTIPNDIPFDLELITFPIGPNLNPPFQTLLFSPFGFVSYSAAYLIWSFLTVITGLLSVYLIFNAYREELRSSHVFELSIVFLLFFPTVLTIILGQFSVLLLFLFTIAWVSARKGRDRISGFTLGIALSLKIFTGLFIPVFLIQRRWKLLVWYLGTFFLCNLLSIFLVGSDEHLKYLRTISSITWYSSSWNPSLMGFATRIFGGSENIPIINAPAVGIILYSLVSLFLILILFWLTKVQQDEAISGFDLIYCLTIVCILIISPLGWIYYYVLMILPLVFAWTNIKGIGENKSRWLLISAWILFSIPHLRIQGKDLIPIDIFTWAGYPLYGQILFLLSLILIFQRSRNRSPRT